RLILASGFDREPTSMQTGCNRHWNSRHVGEGRVFSSVIKLLRIEVAGRVSLLPGYRSSYCFLDFNHVLVTQLRSDTLGACHHMLSRIAGLQQMIWRLSSRQ